MQRVWNFCGGYDVMSRRRFLEGNWQEELEIKGLEISILTS
jgi:hypothetical protein